MTSQGATLPNADAERRWQEWQAKGAAADRRTATRMRILMLVVAVALGIWFNVQLA